MVSERKKERERGRERGKEKMRERGRELVVDSLEVEEKNNAKREGHLQFNCFYYYMHRGEGTRVHRTD